MMRLMPLFFACALFFSASYAQQYDKYDTDLLPKEFHAGRRNALRELLPPRSAAVFFSAPHHSRSNDIEDPYRQNSNFYYLTGLTEPNAVLLLFKDKFENVYRKPDGSQETIAANDFLFVQKRDSSRETWEGERLGTEKAKSLLGFDAVLPGSGFADFKIDFASFDKVFFLPPPEDVADDKNDRGDLFSLIKHFRMGMTDAYHKADSVMLREYVSSLREIKQKEELQLMQKAIDITCTAINELMRTADTGMTEYQGQAVIEFVFGYYGAEHPGFPSILGSGENSCVLHYTLNRRKSHPGELLVADVGAEYHGYSADVTRTIPLNGKFSDEQKAIYNAVLEAQQVGINVCKAGVKFWEPGEAATKIIQRRLRELGIISNESEYRKYFMHGTSHYLGLDVHDVGLYGALKPGNVITVEPGIYIKEGSPCDPKWWNIGVRLEDDVLVTEQGCRVLSTSPATVNDVEKMMEDTSRVFKIK